MPDTPEGDGFDDVFADQFSVLLGPFAAMLIFAETDPFHLEPQTQSAPGISGTPVAMVRMSLEHFKAMTHVMYRQMVEFQKVSSVRVDLPDQVLAAISTTREDWRKFWGET